MWESQAVSHDSAVLRCLEADVEFVFAACGWTAYLGGAEVSHGVCQAELYGIPQVWRIEAALCFLFSLRRGYIFPFPFILECIGGLDCCADLVEGEEEGGRLYRLCSHV